MVALLCSLGGRECNVMLRCDNERPPYNNSTINPRSELVNCLNPPIKNIQFDTTLTIIGAEELINGWHGSSRIGSDLCCASGTVVISNPTPAAVNW